MPLKPWYKIVTPRADLREGRPMDASEFAVHLDKVRDGTAPEDYRDPQRFFDRTYLTENLGGLGAETLRRLSGITTETSAVFNLATQFGGGKTHALTMLFHLAKHGRRAEKWSGVNLLMNTAGIERVPEAAVATFVGTEFDSITGRGGSDGTPLRQTPWGEIAWQLGGKEGFAVVAKHDETKTAPAGDVIGKMLPGDKPALILMDELLNYASRNRKSGLGAQFYSFLQNLSETTRGQNNVVLAVSIPASELEMTTEDQADYARFKKLLDRLGKAVVMSAESETSEIIRRRLFEWGGLSVDAKRAAAEYADWIVDHRDMVPKWFPVDQARETFENTYPFHPMALSVFERKWQMLPRFQQTRGILRLLALWVSAAYQEGFKGAHKDPLIGLGTAPLKDPMFRTAVFEQLGEQKLEGAVTTDICGKAESHAVRLDADAVDAIRKARLHQKAATVVFFESNGGQAKQGEATVPEIRLAVAEPDLDVGNVETALEALTDACYFMRLEKNKYRFGLSPNLNKLLADRRASIDQAAIEERIRAEIRAVFEKRSGVDVCPFPEKSNQIPDRPALTLVVLAPEYAIGEKGTAAHVDTLLREHGSAGRTYKNAVLIMVPDDDSTLRDEGRRLLAWQAIKDDEYGTLDSSQQGQLAENLKKAQRDLREAVWRTYRNVALLGKDGRVRTLDLGLVHSSQANSMIQLVVDRLQQDGDLEVKGVSPNFLVRNWPPAFTEWSTKAVRDAFFASPLFPRLLHSDVVADTIARGVSNGILAYVGKTARGYEPFVFASALTAQDVEISDEMFILTAEEAQKHVEPPRLTTLAIQPEYVQVKPGMQVGFQVKGADQHGRPIPVAGAAWSATGGAVDGAGRFAAGTEEGEFLVKVAAAGVEAEAAVVIAKQGVAPPPSLPSKPDGIKGLTWSGTIPYQKWMNFYTKVLAKFANMEGVQVRVSFEVAPPDGLQPHHVDETKAALRELGLEDGVEKTE